MALDFRLCSTFKGISVSKQLMGVFIYRCGISITLDIDIMWLIF